MAIPNLYAIRDWCLNQFARKKDIPTKTSDLDNDSGFVTSQYPVEILDEEQTEANTTPDKYVSDAMVTRELLLRQNGVQWIVDEDTGAIKGYKTKVGADTEFPFSGKGIPILETINSYTSSATTAKFTLEDTDENPIVIVLSSKIHSSVFPKKPTFNLKEATYKEIFNYTGDISSAITTLVSIYQIQGKLLTGDAISVINTSQSGQNSSTYLIIAKPIN